MRCTVKAMPSYSFAQRYPVKTEEASPGPQHYSPSVEFVSSKGHYPAWRISAAKRGAEQDSAQSPGPGSYNVRLHYHSSSAKLTGRYPLAASEKTPGPCEYNNNLLQFK
jgi:hypothetical protein